MNIISQLFVIVNAKMCGILILHSISELIFMNNRYDVVLFDFDGTFADTGVGIFRCIQYAVNALGKPPLSQETLRTFIGPPVFDSFKRELDLTDNESFFAVEKYRELYAESGIYQFEIYNGIKELFEELSAKGIKIAFASSKPKHFIERIVDYLDIVNLVSYVSGPESDKAHDDKTVLINRAIENLGVDKKRTLMVGDRHFDINGAKNAGVESVGVTYGYGSEDELVSSGATYIAHNTDDLRRIIF